MSRPAPSPVPKRQPGSCCSWLPEKTPERDLLLHRLLILILFLLTLQGLSGGLLLLSYVPAADEAWASLHDLARTSFSGGLLYSFHRHGISLLVAATAVYLFVLLLRAAYRLRNPMLWRTAVALPALVLAFGFTGALLPWNLDGYWTAQVGIEIVESVPLAGPLLAGALRGDAEMSAFTLNRFFALHAFFLPLLLLILVLLHLLAVRRNGYSPPADKAGRSVEWRPNATFQASVLCLLTLAFLLILSLLAPAHPGFEADPALVNVDPRPDWYFLPLFELLQLPIGGPFLLAVVPPLLFLAFLLLLPEIRLSSDPRRDRTVAAGICIATLFAAGASTAYSLIFRPPAIGERVSVTPEQLPPIPSGNAANQSGRSLFVSEWCINCHQVAELGGRLGPPMTDPVELLARDRIRLILLDPKQLNPLSTMPSYRNLREDDIEALIEYVAFLQTLREE